MKMDLKEDCKGGEKDEDWSRLKWLADVAVDVAAEEQPKTLIDHVIFSIGESKADGQAVSSINDEPKPSPDFSKKTKQRVHLKRCIKRGESNRAKKPKPKQKNASSTNFCHQLGLPQTLKQMIKDMNGTNEKLIIQKKLYNTDLNEHHGRLSIPINQVEAEFLTEEEKNVLKQSSKESIEAMVIEPCLKRRKMSLKRWDMKNSSFYVLTGKWISVVEDNGFKAGDVIQVWSFRTNSKLCFALVIVQSSVIEEGR